MCRPLARCANRDDTVGTRSVVMSCERQWGLEVPSMKMQPIPPYPTRDPLDLDPRHRIILCKTTCSSRTLFCHPRRPLLQFPIQLSHIDILHPRLDLSRSICLFMSTALPTSITGQFVQKQLLVSATIRAQPPNQVSFGSGHGLQQATAKAEPSFLFLSLSNYLYIYLPD